MRKTIKGSDCQIDISGNVYRSNGDKAKKFIAANGYYVVNIQINGKNLTKTVHRLLAETFIDNPDNKPFVNHKDGVKTNNNVDNLEWVTHQENMKHASKVLKASVGEKKTLKVS